MLRPEQMSKVSITGSKRVMPDVIETLHDLSLVHLLDYDGSWSGFDPGNPIEGADEASNRLVTVRSIESILGLEEEDISAAADVSEEPIEERIESIRQEVNDLDDRRNDLRDQLRGIDEQLEMTEPFVTLGIDLDLLRGYERIELRVGEGDPTSIRDALTDAIDGPLKLFDADNIVAIAADTDAEQLEDALVGVEFTELEIPDATGDPAEYVSELEHERRELESKLDEIEAELDSLKLEAGRFLLGVEEHLTVSVRKAEAPLGFATTDNAFITEGWLPTDRFTELEAAIDDAAGDHADVEELERASYDPSHGHAEEHEATTDGGTTVSMGDDEPPVIQDNPRAIKPFELLVETINRPQYWDLDPTVILFLTFPLFFGFMIGDLGYGLLYMAIGYGLWANTSRDALKSLGGIALWAGGFTTLFGILYGEIFGLHLITTHFWEGFLGLHGPPIEKGLSPASAEFATAWLAVVTLVGVAHVTLGYLFDFYSKWRGHGVKEAVLESGSWVLLLIGVWIWIFSRSAVEMKPAFLFETFAGHPFPLNFAGFSAEIGMGGLGIAVIGFGLLLVAEGGIGLLESLNVLVNVLSYARIAAVLLAKAGMAFVVNLLFFGVYVTGHGEEAAWHFGLTHIPTVGAEVHGHEVTEIMFSGLLHMGIGGVLGGIVVLVIGHLIVLALGVTSAGLQAIRLEYVEFFSKFYYEGGAGQAYRPFGASERSGE